MFTSVNFGSVYSVFCCVWEHETHAYLGVNKSRKFVMDRQPKVEH